MNVKIKKLNENAVIPKYQTEGAAGFDFHATEHKVIMPGETVNIGDRIAQGVLVPIRPGIFTVVKELSDTARGASGFGSSGV